MSKLFIQIDLEQAKRISFLLEHTKESNADLYAKTLDEIRSIEKKIDKAVHLEPDEEDLENTLMNCMEYTDPFVLDQMSCPCEE